MHIIPLRVRRASVMALVPVVLFMSGVAGRKTAPAPPPDQGAAVTALVRHTVVLSREEHRQEVRAKSLKARLLRAKARIARLGKTARRERAKSWRHWRLYRQAARETRGAIASGEMAAPTTSGLVEFGRTLQSKGYGVGEHPAFGGVDYGAHASKSYHYIGQAIDVTGGDLDWVAAEARKRGFNVYWLVPGHYNHVHVDTGPPRPL